MASKRSLNEPVPGHVMPRFGGIASMMRLPIQADSKDLDACFVGVPLDIGSANRSGTRMGPRGIRHESCLLKPANPATGAVPFESLNVGDIGDVAVNPFNLKDAVEHILPAYKDIIKDGCIPLTMGGDHTITLPILHAMKEKYGPIVYIDLDAHHDTNDLMFGEKIAHGTTFRRAIEAGFVDCDGSIQIGLRGSGYGVSDLDWVIQKGVRIVPAKDCWYKSLGPLMEEIRAKIGPHRPVYLTMDIDVLDPAYAPGTGTPEIGGLTTIQALEIIRGCQGLNIVGADIVEVLPMYDPYGTTCLTAANLLFEMLCVLPGVKYDTPKI